MTKPEVQIDPLNSPYPIPWEWIVSNYETAKQTGLRGTYYHRTKALISLDHQYAAYSKVQLQLESNLEYSSASSTLYVENLRTGDIRAILVASPFNDLANLKSLVSTIVITIPISWSREGDRLLARQFSGYFNSSYGSDSAVIWDKNQNYSLTLMPKAVEYTHAICLGWSTNFPEQVLFQTKIMPENDYSLQVVNMLGDTISVIRDYPLIFGQTINHVWGYLAQLNKYQVNKTEISMN